MLKGTSNEFIAIERNNAIDVSFIFNRICQLVVVIVVVVVAVSQICECECMAVCVRSSAFRWL